MGCDIHAHMEIKVGNEWLYYGQVRFERNYTLFAKLADVRNNGDIKPISGARGIPDCISEMTRIHMDYWKGDGHHHSWVSSEEYAEVIDFMFERGYRLADLSGHPYHDPLYLFGDGFEGFHKYKKDYPDFVQDFRMVFWFDN